MRFQKWPQLPGAGRTRAGHHHGSHTPTSPEGKMAHHTKQISRECINQQSLVFYRWSIYKNSLNKISKRHIPHCWSVCWFELWLQFDLLWGKQAYKSRNSISFCHLVKSYQAFALIKLSARCITACTTNTRRFQAFSTT